MLRAENLALRAPNLIFFSFHCTVKVGMGSKGAYRLQGKRIRTESPIHQVLREGKRPINTRDRGAKTEAARALFVPRTFRWWPRNGVEKLPPSGISPAGVHHLPRADVARACPGSGTRSESVLVGPDSSRFVDF